MGQLAIYDKEDTQITAELGLGYKELYTELEERYDSDEQLNADICRVVESIILSEIQSQSGGPGVHPALAELVLSLDETGEIDIDSVVQNSIHQLAQSAGN
jgi:hypothetical protein